MSDQFITEHGGFLNNVLSDNGNMQLDKNHPYFFQCQMQMLVIEQLYCNFVVWASVGDIHIERTSFDKNFIEL